MSISPISAKSVKPSAEFVTVTPSLAQEWMGRNTKNRPKKNQKIAMYSRDIQAGNWFLTGEAIKFDWNGRVIDGQNRLLAIIDAGIPTDLLVVNGLDPEVQAVLDSGAPRSARDALNMKGFERSSDLAATVLAHSLWGNGTFKHCMTQTPGYARPTNYEVVEYVFDNQQLIDSVKMAKLVQRRVPLAIGALATAHEQISRVDADDAYEFFDRLRDGRTYGTGDPVLTLIDKAQHMRDNRERRWPSTCLYLIFRAWNAYRSGKNLSTFRFGNDVSGWSTIPEPK